MVVYEKITASASSEHVGLTAKNFDGRQLRASGMKVSEGAVRRHVEIQNSQSVEAEARGK
jgi:hypothetical protein